MDIDTVVDSVYRQKLSGVSIRLLRVSYSQDGGFTGKFKRFRLADAPPFYTASYVGSPLRDTNCIAVSKTTSPAALLDVFY
jgi:hypothetical protein